MTPPKGAKIRYLVASISSTGQASAASIIDAVDAEYAAMSRGLDGASIYVVDLKVARVFRKAVTPTIAEVSPGS